MSIKSDKWIEKMACNYGMIEPFEIMQVRNRLSKVHPGDYSFIVGDGESGYYI